MTAAAGGAIIEPENRAGIRAGVFGEAEMRRWWSSRDFIGSIPEMPIGPEVSQREAAAEIIAALGGTSDN